MNKHRILPIDITHEMLDAGESVYQHSYTGTMTAAPDQVHTAMVNAAPVRELVVTTDSDGNAVAVTIQDEDHRILEVLWESK